MDELQLTSGEHGRTDRRAFLVRMAAVTGVIGVPAIASFALRTSSAGGPSVSQLDALAETTVASSNSTTTVEASNSTTTVAASNSTTTVAASNSTTSVPDTTSTSSSVPDSTTTTAPTSTTSPSTTTPSTTPTTTAPATFSAPGQAFVGSSITVQGSGMPADSDVDIYLFSDPVRTGTVHSDPNGQFSGKVRIPQGVAPGPHTLVASSGSVNVAAPITVLGVASIPATR
ncbi:MAG: hypothetical protein JWM34_2528 [Ilumatobacteraceae bacterium]|nr:hypothetical protein [Ilumatobacteraceae bacterium]